MESKGGGVLGQFSRVVRERHGYAREWQQRSGGRVVGYLCSYVPEEILYAAGALPVRVLGGHEPQDLTEPHIFGMFCAYCRDTLAQGLQGRYDYLDGLVLAHICPHIRQTYESWCRHLPIGFHSLLWVPPQVQSQPALPFFRVQMEGFSSAVQAWARRPVSDDALCRAMAVYDHNRSLLRRLYELRKEDPPAVSGATAMEVVLASALMDKAEHSRFLEELLLRPGEDRPSGTRLMVVGSENDDIALIQLLESLGAVVVIEDNCLGNRYFWNDVPADGDPLTALARRYLEKLPCPLLDLDRRRRGAYLLELAQEYQVQGVVFLRQKFCDPHGWEHPVIQSLFQEAGLPCLSLELDFTVPVGQFRTRIEAFMELFL